MLCDECKKNEATVHTISKINGVTTERHLCAECNKKHMAPIMKMSIIGDLFSNAGALFAPKQDVIICPKCGMTSEDFLETGYVGCANCYKEFEPILLPTVEKMQNATRHVGKIPNSRGEATVNPNPELLRLKKELAEAVAKEDFERAETIMKSIKKLEGNQK